MKRRTPYILMMILAFVTVACFTACGSNSTLESYISDHPEVKADIDAQLGADEYKGITVEFKGNEIIYSFDLANLESMTEEEAKSDETKDLIQQGLDSNAEAFKAIANTVLQSVRDDGGEIEKVIITVYYSYGEETVATRSFESDPIEGAGE